MKNILRFLVLLLLPLSAWSLENDLVLQHTVAPLSVSAGGDVVFTMTARNDGDATTITNVQLTDTLPSGVNFVSAVPAQGTCNLSPVPAAGDTFTCDLGSLAPNTETTVLVTVTTVAAQIITNTASITSTTGGFVDPQTNNNDDDPQSITVKQGANLSVLITGSPDPSIQSGATMTYNLTVSNAGPNAATSVQVVDTLPPGFVRTGSLPAGCSQAGQVVTCSVSGSIANGGTRVIGPITGVIALSGGSTMTNQASVSVTSPSAPQDPIPAGNTDTLDTNVTPGSDVSMTKTQSEVSPITAGTAFGYTLQARYSGEIPQGIIVTDNVPVGLTVQFVTGGAGWDCSASAGQLVSCTRPTGGAAVGSNVVMPVIVVQVNADTDGAYTNTATIASTGNPTDPSLGNNSSSIAMTVLPANADLSPTKFARRDDGSGLSPALVVVNDTFKWRLNIKNNGPSDFDGVLTLTDTLPANVRIDSYTNSSAGYWTCSPAAPVTGPATITCSTAANTVLTNGSTSSSVDLNATALAAASLSNSVHTTASVDSNGILDLNAGNNAISSGVTSQTTGNSADIEIIKTVSGTVTAGDPLIYTLEIVNHDTTAATSVSVSDTFSNLINNLAGAGEGLEGWSTVAGNSTLVDGNCFSGTSTGTGRAFGCNNVTVSQCTQGTDCPIITVTVRPNGGTTPRDNTATAFSQDVSDPDISNNTSNTVSSTVGQRTDLIASITDSPDPVRVGENITYVATAINQGVSAAADSTMTVTLPEGMTFISATPAGGGSCSVTPVVGDVTTAGAKTVTCSLGALALPSPGNTTTKALTIIVRPTLLALGATTATADVSTTTTETDVSNNGATTSTLVNPPQHDMEVFKVDDLNVIGVGDTVVYTITAINNGPSYATNVQIVDTLPATQLTFVSAVPSSGTCPAPVGNVLTCNLGDLSASANATVAVTMTGLAKGIASNDVVVSSAETRDTPSYDPTIGNEHKIEETTIKTKVDMEVVSKIATPATVNLRDNFTYTIIVQNNGPDEADGVFVNDDLVPAGMELTATPTAVIAGTTTNNSCTGASGSTSFSCDFGTVNNGTAMTITVPVKVVTLTSSSVPPFTNTATVTTTSIELDASNNSNTGAVLVNASSIAGRVFRDFDSNGAVTGSDSGIPAITITLTGTAHDGSVVNKTTTTDASGNYSFTGLPESNATGYTVTEGAIPLAEHVVDGVETAGSTGVGSTATNDVISAIVLPAFTDFTEYLFAEIPVPLIGLAKSASGVVNHHDGTYSVTFTLNVDNAGGTPLDTVQITDDLTTDFGSYTASAVPLANQYTITSAPSIISPVNGAVLAGNASFTGEGVNTGLLNSAASALPNFGASSSAAQVQFSLRFFPVDAGPFNNTAVTTGVWPDTGTAVTDDSMNGIDSDPTSNEDPTDDSSPTPVNIFGQAIGVAKMVDGGIVQTGLKRYTIPYSLIVSNVATATTATNVQVSDNLNATFPTAQTITISSPSTVSACTGTVLIADPSFNGTGQNNLLVGNQNLLVGESCTIKFEVEVDFGSNALPTDTQNNQAKATTSQLPGGTVIATDLSDDGAVVDANSNNDATEAGEDDPTPVSFASGIMASVSGRVWLDDDHGRDYDAGETLIADFIVEVVNAAGQIVGTATTDTNGEYTVAGLFPSTPADASTEYTIRFRDPVSRAIYGNAVSQDPNAALNGTLENGVINGVQLTAGNTTLNQSLPLDPAGVIYDSVTRLAIEGATVTLLSGGSNVPDHCLISGVNTQTTGPSGFYQYLLINPLPAGCPGDAVYTISVIQPGGYLPPESGSIPATAGPHTPVGLPGGVEAIQSQAGAPQVPPNVAVADDTTYFFSFNLALGGVGVVNNHIPLDPLLGGAIAVTKTTPKTNVVRGELVPYTVTATNTLASALSNITMQDQIPPGFKYVERSATINGVSVEPTVAGRSLDWPGLTFAANEVKTIQLILIVGAGVSEGKYVNQAWALNSIADARVSNIATATVRIVPDPLFDCSDLIGKVFDDKNINGYQDEGEVGLAGVRVVTPRGLLITTDDRGRFHLTCADVPNELHGSNFIMKLDERTLPSGYRVTTENPRVVRLTRGKLIKLNFGAALHRMLRIDVDSSSFNDEGDVLTTVASTQLGELIDILKQQPSQVRLSYALKEGEEKADAKQRMQLFTDQLTELWQQCDCGNYALTIEQEIIMQDGDTTVWSATGRAK